MQNEQTFTEENKMGVMPIHRLLITMALPMMASMLVQALYNLVDSIFVSRISEEALTAVSMATPMQNLLIGLATGIGVGTNALLSKALGAKDQDTANKMAMHGIFLCLICYALFLILGLTIARPFFVLQGATDAVADYGRDYLTIVMCVSFGIYAEIIFERLLLSTGKTVYTMISQGTGAIINIIFDPLLIFGIGFFPEMGIKGAATATVMGQIIAAVLAIIFHFKVNHEIQINFSEFRPRLRTVGEILYIGIPSVIMVAIGSAMSFGVNRILSTFSSTAVAVFGVYFRLQNFAFMPIFGMNNALVPIASYNYGAAKPDRIIGVVRFAMIIAECIMLFVLLIFQIFAPQLLLLFNASESMLTIGVPAIRTISISFVFAGICVICGSFFQALGNSIYSTIVSFMRQLVVLLPLVWVFSQTGRLSLVWLAWPLAEIVSLTFSLIFLFRINKKVIRPLRNQS